MKNILVLGAGQSTPFLIQHLLDQSQEYDWFVTVGDRDLDMAQKRIRSHPRSTAVRFDINDADMRSSQIDEADIVINMLPPACQQLVALECIHGRTHMISASYRDIHTADLDRDANRHGVLILNEMGFDPGIDHMSTMEVINSVRRRGGKITSFKSYGSGRPAPDSWPTNSSPRLW